jgi:hypothetical protein
LRARPPLTLPQCLAAQGRQGVGRPEEAASSCVSRDEQEQKWSGRASRPARSTAPTLHHAGTGSEFQPDPSTQTALKISLTSYAKNCAKFSHHTTVSIHDTSPPSPKRPGQLSTGRPRTARPRSRRTGLLGVWDAQTCRPGLIWSRRLRNQAPRARHETAELESPGSRWCLRVSPTAPQAAGIRVTPARPP